MATATIDIYSALSQVGISIFSGAIAALIATKLSLGRFYKEKWWEKRALAFNDLINSVYVINDVYKRALEECYAFTEGDALISKEEWSKSHDLHSQFDKLSLIGPLTITDKASEMLKIYLKKRREIYDQVGVDAIDATTAFSIMAEESHKLLDCLLVEAKRELKIK